MGCKAKGEQNETAGWPERNGMNGSTLACVPRLEADNERKVTEGGETECSPGVLWREAEATCRRRWP